MEASQEKRSATKIIPLEDFEPTQIAPETPTRLRAGQLCPVCQRERLDYDGLLNLSCPNCGVAVGGCFT